MLNHSFSVSSHRTWAHFTCQTACQKLPIGTINWGNGAANGKCRQQRTTTAAICHTGRSKLPTQTETLSGVPCSNHSFYPLLCSIHIECELHSHTVNKLVKPFDSNAQVVSLSDHLNFVGLTYSLTVFFFLPFLSSPLQSCLCSVQCHGSTGVASHSETGP